jgi:hypothetical protein
MSNKYTVHFKVIISERVEVIAANEDEAKKKAIEEMSDMTDDYELTGIDFTGEFVNQRQQIEAMGAKMRDCVSTRKLAYRLKRDGRA